MRNNTDTTYDQIQIDLRIRNTDNVITDDGFGFAPGSSSPGDTSRVEVVTFSPNAADFRCYEYRINATAFSVLAPRYQSDWDGTCD